MAWYISDDELYHHGVKGQKWGIRRYQNEDGTRTPEGKRRRRNNAMLTNDLAEILENKQVLQSSDLKGDISNATKNRAIRDADLGLKALDRIGRDSYDKKTGITDNDRSWFMFEDQTIGHLAVADLVNQGKTKKQIYDLLDQAKKMSKNDDTGSTFELSEFARGMKYGNRDFLDACFEIKESEKRK